MAAGFVSFPGIAAVKECRYTRSLGTLPDAAMLTIVPQSGTIAAGGTLQMAFDGVGVSFPDCKVDFGSLRITTAGHVVGLRILDRRWRWQYGAIAGRWNIRFADGTFDPSTEQTPQELATRLFNEMGESLFDVSQLPNADRPEVNWEYDNPADELSRLCERRGCQVKLGLDNIPRIVRLGLGANLPDTGDVRSISHGENPPELPSAILFVGGPTEVQSKLLLEAVGIDTDNTVKPLDNLSYRPSIGWGEEDPELFQNVLNENGQEEVELARESVFRWFRVKSQADGTQNVPGIGPVGQVRRILPVNDTLLETYIDLDSLRRPRPAYVEGTFLALAQTDRAGPPIETNTPDCTRVDYPFSLDRQHGIVKFSVPIYQLGTGDTIAEPELYFVTSYPVQNDVRAYYRFTKERTLGGTAGVHVIRQDEIHAAIAAQYTGCNTLSGTTDNELSVNTNADAFLDAAQLNFQTVESLTVEYRGIQPIDLDGAIRQVTWHASDKVGEGYRTWASRNSERDINVLRYPERRRIEQQREETRVKEVEKKRRRDLAEKGLP